MEDYYIVKTNGQKGLVDDIKYSSYKDAFDRAVDLRDKYGVFVWILRCEVINHFAPLEDIENYET